MALPLHTTITVSCEQSQENSGPAIVHSTGVEGYRIPPELIRILQVSCGNDKLCDHETGVQCTHPVGHLLQVLKNAGFSAVTESSSSGRKIWVLTKTSEGGAGEPSHQPDNNQPADGGNNNGEEDKPDGEEGGEEEGDGEAEEEEGEN